MSQLLLDTFAAFLRSDLMLAIAALVVWLSLRLVRPRSPLTHRAAWGCVLVAAVAVALLLRGVLSLRGSRDDYDNAS